MTITTLLTDLASVVHGTTTNKVPNIYGIINRAARAVLLDVDPKETQRIVPMPQIFDDVFDYSLPPDVKGDRLVDLRLQAGRLPWEVFEQGYAESFDAEKLVSFKNKIYTQWNTGLKTIRIEAPFLTSPVTITDTGSVDGWLGLDVSNIQLNTTMNVAGGGAISFNLDAGASIGEIYNTTLTPVDLSALENVGTIFLWVYLPDASAIQAIDVIWGSQFQVDDWEYLVTQTQQGTAFVNGWNLISVPWASANVNGTPDASQISFVAVDFNHSGQTLQTGVQICNMTAALGFYFDLQYYSKYLFRSPAGVFVEEIVDATQNNYLINFDTESYNLLFNKTAFFIAQALQGADADYDATYWDSEYQEALKRYKAQNPSEAKLKGSTYYQLPNKSYNRFSNPFWRQ